MLDQKEASVTRKVGAGLKLGVVVTHRDGQLIYVILRRLFLKVEELRVLIRCDATRPSRRRAARAHHHPTAAHAAHRVPQQRHRGLQRGTQAPRPPSHASNRERPKRRQDGIHGSGALFKRRHVHPAATHQIPHVLGGW